MSKLVTKVCVTVNNYTGEGYEAFKAKCVDMCKYAVIGKEVGESGTRHLQCFLILKKRARLNSVTKWIETVNGKHPFTCKANGSNQEASDYCKKDGIFWEHGSFPAGRGARTDIKEFLDAVKESKDDEFLAEHHPNEYAKYHAAMTKLRGTMKQKTNKAKNKSRFDGAPLRNWQIKILDKLKEQDDRQVLWVYDQLGNLGKSWLANWLTVNENAYLVEGGKRADIAHAYDYEDMVIFDYTRSQEEQVNYSVIESFKNGRIFAPKYESKMKIFKPCKVLCLSNFDPDRSKLSQDRWKVVQFDGPCRQHWMTIPKSDNNNNNKIIGKKRKRRKAIIGESELSLPSPKKPRLSRQNVLVQNEFSQDAQREEEPPSLASLMKWCDDCCVFNCEHVK